MANEIPGEYDYLMIACGPVALADRIADPAGAVRTTYDLGPAAAFGREAAGGKAIAEELSETGTS